MPTDPIGKLDSTRWTQIPVSRKGTQQIFVLAGSTDRLGEGHAV